LRHRSYRVNAGMNVEFSLKIVSVSFSCIIISTIMSVFVNDCFLSVYLKQSECYEITK
jgi:hypothetical protein